MKKNIFPLIFILLTLPFIGHSNNSDSLIKERNIQYEELISIRNSLADSSSESLLNLIKQMDSMLETDNNVINEEFNSVLAENDSAMIKSEKLLTDLKTTEKGLAFYEDNKMYALIGLAALIFIFLIIIIISSSGKRKLKKKFKKLNHKLFETTDLEEKLQKTEEELLHIEKKYKTELSELNKKQETLLTANNKKLLEKEQEFQKLKSNTEGSTILQKRITEAENKLKQNKADSENFKREKEATERELNQLKSRIESSQNEHLAELQKKEALFTSMQEEMKQIKKEKNELEVEMISLRSNNNEKDTNSEELNKLRDQTEKAEKDLVEKNDYYQTNLEKLRTENEEIKHQLEKEINSQKELEEKANKIGEKISTISGNDDIVQLKKELLEERKFRLEIQTLLEGILKK